METVTPMSPISPSAGVTAADAIGARQRRLSFVPKTPSQLSRSSLPISPPVTPDKQNFFDPGIKSTTPEDDDVFQSLPQVAAATQRLSFVASSQGKGRKAPPAALDLSPQKQIALSKLNNQVQAGRTDKPKAARLDMKILEGIARRGGQVPGGIPPGPSGTAASISHNGPLMPKTPKVGVGAHMGVFGLGIVASPLPLSALSPPTAGLSYSANISHAHASAVTPITAIHKGRQMTFSPLPPEPDELGRCTLIDEEGDPVTVYPRELQNWLYLPWVYWGMVCGRTFNLWFEPRQ